MRLLPATLRACLGLLSLSLLAGPPAPGQTAAPPVTPPPTLTIMPEAGVTMTGNGTAIFDAGIVDPQKSAHVDHTFTLRNAGTVGVAITRLHGSCGCETLLLLKNGQAVKTVTLAPGEAAQVQAAVRTVGQPAGVLHKYIWVEGTSATVPLATLAVQLQVREPFLAAPTFLNFGSVATGTARALPLTLMVDTAPLPGGALPPLVSTNPAVQVRPNGAAQAVPRDGRASLRQTYTVTLSEAVPAGRLSGSLHFESAVPALSALSVPIVADVTGHITASPKTIFFGSVVAGHAVTRQVLLNMALPEAGAGLTVSGGGPWLTATLHAPAGAGSVRVLDVTLSAQAPAGVVQSQFTVLAGTDRLILPVVADVVGPAH